MERLLAALHDLREVQEEISRKQEQFQAAVTCDDDDLIRDLQAELSELFKRSDAAFAHLHAQFGRVGCRGTAANQGSSPE